MGYAPQIPPTTFEYISDRAGVRQHPTRTGAGPVHAEREGESEHPVEAVQHSAQSYEDLPLWMATAMVPSGLRAMAG